MFVVTPLYAATDEDAIFQEALKKREVGEYFEAIKLLEQILATNPGLGRARIELALTEMKALKYAEARSHAQQVLDNPETPNGVKRTVRDFLVQLNKQSQTHSFTPSLNVGYLYDDNANIGPASDTIEIAGTEITLTPASRPQSDQAFTVNASLTHRYLSPNTVKIGDMDAAFLWSSSASFNRIDYQDESDADIDVLKVRTGPTLVVAGKGRVGVYGQVDDIKLGHDSLATYATLGANVTFKVSKANVTVSGRFSDRDYKSSSSGRDSNFKDLGISVSYPLSDAFTLQGSVRVFDNDADDDRYTNHGTEVGIGAIWRAWKGGTVRAKLSRKSADYKGLEPLFTVSRDDDLDKFSLQANHEIASGWLESWVVSGFYVYYDNSSPVDLYDYDRQLIGINLGKAF